MEKRKYYQEEIETMPVEQIKKLQSEKLIKQVAHVYKNAPYYRDLMVGITATHVQTDESGIKL